MSLQSRMARPEDSPLLYELHREAMGDHVAAVFGSWDEDLQRHLHDQWFDPRRVRVLEMHGEAVGSLDVTWHADRLSIDRIELDRDHRGEGLGSAVLRGLLAEADLRRLPTTVEVFEVNPAMRLYLRLGFREVSRTDHKLRMVRPPAHGGTGSGGAGRNRPPRQVQP